MATTPSGTPIKTVTVNAQWFAIAHTVCAYLAFGVALVVGWYLHYEKIVKNSSFGYPDEWFPLVSATIGDRYPERLLFQILIALCAGPRFLLLIFNYIVQSPLHPKLALTSFISGFLRTWTCGGWVYITSTDDHDAHDVFMILYIVLTLPWEICTILASPKGLSQRQGRLWTCLTFFGTLGPLIYYFIQHKVHVVPGAYSIYAYFEWALIILDVAFDAWLVIDFKGVDVTILSAGISVAPAAGAAVKVDPVKSVAAPVESYVVPDEALTVTFIALCINHFIQWLAILSLFLTLWHFPLWSMGISGYEACIVVLFVAPLLVIPKSVRRVLGYAPWLTRAATVITAVGAYKVPDPRDKFLTVVAGCGFAVISQVVEALGLLTQPKKYTSWFVLVVVGLLALLVAKFYWYSNNPIWPVMHDDNGGLNALWLFVGLTGAFLTPSVVLLSQDTVVRKGGSIILALIGLGGWLYCLCEYMTDLATLVQWVWTGYPLRGPTPVSGALIHFGAFILGIVATIKVSPTLISQLGYLIVVGGLAAVAMATIPGWAGYVGALAFVFYLASVTTVIAQLAVGFSPVVTYVLGYFWFIVLNVAHVWTVAYAFVPGGWLLRERAHIIHGAAFVSVVLGVVNYRLRSRASHIARLNLGTARLFKQAMTVLTVLLAALVAVFIRRTPLSPYSPHRDDNFNAGIWCVHFGLDNDMWLSEVRMRDLIRDAELDIVGLLETDTQRNIGGHRDFTQRIAEDLGMYVDYGPGPNKHTWGCALLSKFPILRLEHHLLPLPVGELAPAIHATLDIYGTEVDVVVFHLGQEEDEEDRRLQLRYLAKVMGGSHRPMILLLYLVTEPLNGNYFTYAGEELRMHDIDLTDWDRWCEYIMFRGVQKVAYARISRSTITDTELQVAKFKLLPAEEAQELDEDFYYGNHFVPENKVPPHMRMPQIFHGDGVRGHRYHVFDEPRYFAQDRDQLNEATITEVEWSDVEETEA